MDGHLVIVKTALLAEKTVETVELRLSLQKFVEKQQTTMKPKRRANKLDGTTSETAMVGTSTTAGQQVNQIETMFQKHSLCDANYDSDYDEFDDTCFAIISDSDNIREVEPVNVNIGI